jgi:hypothetical protein
LNIPGTRLDEARQAYDTEPDPERRRVKGAMLAGALFNRATDIFRKLVELQALGVEITPENELLAACGQHFQEALELGKLVHHRSGEEGIDELWGEPLKAFSFPVEDFYRNRYVKISQTMRDIDRVCDELAGALAGQRAFAGVEPLIADLAAAAKTKCETLRTDPDIFDVWASFAVARDRLGRFEPGPVGENDPRVTDGLELLRRGKDLVTYITRARVPMPKSTTEFLGRCRNYPNSEALSRRGGRQSPSAARGSHSSRS